MQDHPDITVKLAKNLISCKIPEGDDELKKKVVELQTHKHTDTCWKKGRSCRFNFPKLPSDEFLIARPLPDDMDEKVKQEKLKKCKDILEKAKEILEDPDINETMTYEDFVKMLKVSKSEYKEALSISERGSILILERNVNERFINNYNPLWLSAWNANIDIQLAFEIYAVLTYVVSYYGKDETGLTKFLSDTLKNCRHLPWKEKLNALKFSFLTHRQIGLSEAIYRTLPFLHLKESNITCIFVSSGYPEHRSVYYRKLCDEFSATVQQQVDEIDNDNDDAISADEIEQAIPDLEQTVTIEGRTGKYQKAITMDDKYTQRPKCLEDMCLAQFATSYSYASSVPKGIKFSEDGMSLTNEGIKVTSLRKYGETENELPCYLKLKSIPGYLRLRKVPAVLRFHLPPKKDGDERYYAELFLYFPWRNEENDLPRKCLKKYNDNSDVIVKNKQGIFPFSSTMELLENGNINLEEDRPTHVYDLLDSNLEQQNQDDEICGNEEDSEYAGRDPDILVHNVEKENKNYDSFKYKSIEVPETEELAELFSKLDVEQKWGLSKLISHAKDIVRERNIPKTL